VNKIFKFSYILLRSSWKWTWSTEGWLGV